MENVLELGTGHNFHDNAGLGTTFFSVLNVSFFSGLLKNAMFFFFLFLSFWRLMKPKRMLHYFPFFSKEWKRTQKSAKNAMFFCKECKRTQRMQCSFAKNVKERKNVLFSIYIYRYIYIY